MRMLSRGIKSCRRSEPACIPAPHVILRARIPMIRQAALIRLYGARARAQVTFTFSMNHNIDRSLSIGAAYRTSD